MEKVWLDKQQRDRDKQGIRDKIKIRDRYKRNKR